MTVYEYNVIGKSRFNIQPTKVTIKNKCSWQGSIYDTTTSRKIIKFVKVMYFFVHIVDYGNLLRTSNRFEYSYDIFKIQFLPLTIDFIFSWLVMLNLVDVFIVDCLKICCLHYFLAKLTNNFDLDQKTRHHKNSF